MWLSWNILVARGYFSLSQEEKTYWLVQSIYSLFPLSQFVPCSIVLSHFFIPSIHLTTRSYILHSLTPSHTQKHASALKQNRAHALKPILALLFFRSADEIFKRHFCSYLIACQHSLHEDSDWSEEGNEAWVRLGSVMFSENPAGTGKRWVKRKNVECGHVSSNNTISNS